MTTEKKRIEFIDLAKGICILLVLLLHIVPSIDEKVGFLSCFRMPLYFCLSGLFYKNYGSYGNFIIKKVNKVLVPFVAWYIIGYSIYYIGRFLLPSGNEATFHFLDIFRQNEIFNLPIWFLLCLFWANAIFALVDKVSRNWIVQTVMVFAVAVVGLSMNSYSVFNILYIGSAMTSLPFFYFGYALKRTTILYPCENVFKEYILFIVVTAIGLCVALIPDIPPHFEFYTNKIVAGNILEIYSVGFFLVVGVLMLCKYIKRIPYVSWLGRYSIIVLVTHMWLRDVCGTLLSKTMNLPKDSLSLQIVNLIIIVALMSVVIPFCRKFLPHITAQKDLIYKEVPQNNKAEV